MESSPIPSCTAQNSMKVVCSGSSNEPDEVMIDALSADQISKLKAKGKLEEVSVESGYSSEGFSPESDNNFDDSDEYDAYEYDVLQSHFDKLDLSTDTEYHIPWLQESIKTSASPSETSYEQFASSQSQPNRVDPSSTSKFTFHPKTKLSPATRRRSTPFRLVKEQSFTKPVSAQNMPYSQSQNMPYNEFGSGYNFSHIPYSYTECVMSPNSDSFSFVESSSGLESLDINEVLKRYESFKNFDTAVDFSDHLYVNHNSSMTQPPKNWAKRIQEEWRILEKDLPETIFVRVYETRMDILRAAIIGAQGTPYHDGLFFFDVCFPSNYPNSPPLVLYRSHGLHINPNMYDCGYVCLSLLNTWYGSQEENWIPGTSTMLQVLVSIQGLILNTEPYFNEPGFAHSIGTVSGKRESLLYNEHILRLSLKTMVYTMNKPPKNFEELVVGHFRKRVRDILMACKAYMEGVQVGCVVRGGVQDVVDEGDNKCSAHFKNGVSSYIKTLIAAFKNIGANEADEFLTLSETKIFLPPLAPPNDKFSPLALAPLPPPPPPPPNEKISPPPLAPPPPPPNYKFSPLAPPPPPNDKFSPPALAATPPPTTINDKFSPLALPVPPAPNDDTSKYNKTRIWFVITVLVDLLIRITYERN